MTAIGHFSVASETVLNPSIITFVMNLKGPPLTCRDFVQLWEAKEMPTKHPRFHQTVTTTDPSSKGNKSRSLEFVEEDTVVADHVTETVYPVNRGDLRQRLQRLQLDRWNLADSLWHVWIASPNLKAQAAWSLNPVKTFQQQGRQ